MKAAKRDSITRSITEWNVVYLGYDVEAATTEEYEATLYKDPKNVKGALKDIQKDYETESFRVLYVKEITARTYKYVMSLEKFIANSTKIEKEETTWN